MKLPFQYKSIFYLSEMNRMVEVLNMWCIESAYFTRDRNTKEFLNEEISTIMAYRGTEELDREGVRDVLKVSIFLTG